MPVPVAEPLLSVVIVAPAGTSSIARTMQHLHEQTARRELEVIVVAPSADMVDADALGASVFAAFRVASVGPITARGAAAAAGMLAASAPIVGLIEDHSFPEPGWAEAIIGAHRGSWAGVGPAVENANPTSTMGWVNFILSYGIFSGAQQPGVRDILPWHNSAYKRTALQPFADRLGALLEWEGSLQDELRSRGHTLYLEPMARTHHLNVSGFTSTLGLNVLRGRLLGARRAAREGWPAWRRLLQVAACPLFPLLQFRQMAPTIRHMRIPRALKPGVLAGLCSTLCVMAIGEAWGFALGAGAAIAGIEDYEIHRLKHLSRREIREIALNEL